MERCVHMSLLLYLEMICENVAELRNIWNCFFGQGHLIYSRQMSGFLH